MWVARQLDYEIVEMIKAFPNLETIQEPGIYIKILPKEFPNNYAVLFVHKDKWFRIFTDGTEDALHDIIISIRKGEIEYRDLLGELVV